MKRRDIVHLLVNVGGDQYILGTLRFNAGELSYFFTYPSDSSEKHLYCNTGESTSRLDHITWHNGRVHTKRKDNVAIEVFEWSGPLLTEIPVLTPLYVESLYIDGIPSLLEAEKFTPWSGSVSQEILSLDVSSGFSLIFLLAPSKVSTAELLTGLQFAKKPEGFAYVPILLDLCDLEHRAGRIQVWDGWDMVIVTTPFVQQVSSPIPDSIGGSYRLSNYISPQVGLTDLMLQANETCL